MKLSELFEARKNPDLNPKISVNKTIIELYKKSPILYSIDDKNCFVSFTEIDKLGVNPSSSYKTPLGIYSYPASYIVDEIGPEGSMAELPFAGDEPYANIFSVAGNIINIAEDSDLDKYYKKIANHYAQNSGKPWKESVDIVEDIINNASKYAKFANKIGGRFWYITLEVAKLLSKPRTIQKQKGKEIIKIETDSTPIEWNKLFRSIGIDGVVDYGSGIIHTSEPYQAVFFSKSNIKNNKRVYNKYSFDDVQRSIKHGAEVKQIKNKNEEIRQYAATHTPAEFYDTYSEDDIEVITDPKVMVKFLQYDPKTFELFNANHLTDVVIKKAISLDINNWEHIPKQHSTLELFKYALGLLNKNQQLRFISNDPLIGKDSNETKKIKAFVNELFK